MNENSSKVIDLEIVGDEMTLRNLDPANGSVKIEHDATDTTIRAVNSDNEDILKIESGVQDKILSTDITNRTKMDIGIADDRESSSFTLTSDVTKTGPSLKKIDVHTQANAVGSNYPIVKTIKIVRADCTETDCDFSMSMTTEDAFQLTSSGAYKGGKSYFLPDLTTKLIHWNPEKHTLLDGDHEGHFLQKVMSNAAGEMWQMGAISSASTIYSDGNIIPLGMNLSDGDTISIGSLILDETLYDSDLNTLSPSDDVVQKLDGYDIWSKEVLITDNKTGAKSFQTSFYNTLDDANNGSDPMMINFENVNYPLNAYNADLDVLYHNQVVVDSETDHAYPLQLISDESLYSIWQDVTTTEDQPLPYVGFSYLTANGDYQGKYFTFDENGAIDLDPQGATSVFNEFTAINSDFTPSMLIDWYHSI